MTIPELLSKIKGLREVLETKEIFTAMLIVLVGVTAFSLGRLSFLESKTQDIRVSDALPFESAQTASAVAPLQAAVFLNAEDRNVPAPLAPGGKVVASKSGTKYHYPWCSGAQRISEANKVWFDSVELARKAGYTPAANCKGLR